MGFLYGFSSWLLSNVDFNPVSGLPTETILLNRHQVNDESQVAIQCWAIKHNYRDMIS